MSNKNLSNAKKAKNDEFYTQLSDIEKELKYYHDELRGKVVYCNCDDPRESNFFKYFYQQFDNIGLKKLICTGYKKNGKGVVCIYDGRKTVNGKDDEVIVNELVGDGDFRSEECIEYLKESDIVVTNPPFSLFREYIAQLFEYGKKFLIIGNMNAVNYKEIFPHIKNGKVWDGYKSCGGGMNMIQPKDTFDETKTKSFKINEKGEIIKNIMGCIWFTNLPNNKKETPVVLVKTYNEEEYPKYDNYDAIECGKIVNVPKDMPIGSVVGVPITIVDKITSDGKIYFESDCKLQEWKIVWQASGNSYNNAPKEILEKLCFNPEIKYGGGFGTCVLKGKATYSRFLIERVK